MPRYEFGEITCLTAVALGQPGKRTFYLLLGQGNLRGRFWLEKEQLQALGVGIERLLAALEMTRGTMPLQEDPTCLDPGPDLPPAAEFKVGQLSIGYDEDRDRIALLVSETEGAEDEVPVTCWASRGQMLAFSKRISEVCAAGRPICPLCTGPIDPEGHICPRANGHHSIPV